MTYCRDSDRRTRHTGIKQARWKVSPSEGKPPPGGKDGPVGIVFDGAFHLRAAKGTNEKAGAWVAGLESPVASINQREIRSKATPPAWRRESVAFGTGPAFLDEGAPAPRQETASGRRRQSAN